MPIEVPDNMKGFTYVQCSEPLTPQQGDSWYNPELGRNWFWNGNIWVRLAIDAALPSFVAISSRNSYDLDLSAPTPQHQTPRLQLDSNDNIFLLYRNHHPDEYFLLGKLDPNGDNFIWMFRLDNPASTVINRFWLHIDETTDDIYVMFSDGTGTFSSRDLYISKIVDNGLSALHVWTRVYGNGSWMEFIGTNYELQGVKPITTSLDGSKIYIEWGTQLAIIQRHIAAISAVDGSILYYQDWDLAGESSLMRYIGSVDISPYDETIVLGGTSFSSSTLGDSMYYHIEDTGSSFNLLDSALINGPYYNSIVKTEFMEDGTLLLVVPRTFDQHQGVLRVTPHPTMPSIVWSYLYGSPGAGSFVGDGANTIYDPGVDKIYNLSHNIRIGYPTTSDVGLNFNIIDPDNITELFTNIDITTNRSCQDTDIMQLFKLDSFGDPVILYKHWSGATFPVTDPSDGITIDNTVDWSISPLFPSPVVGATLNSLDITGGTFWFDAPVNIPPHSSEPPSVEGFSIIKLGVTSIPCPDQ